MSKIKCVIVDDEPLARKLIKEHVDELDELVLHAELKSAIELRDYLNDTEVDLIFLDINMPKLSGINFLKNYKSDALVIFTTAYPEFAVEAFEYSAFDYLVKPISFERFLKSMDKVKAHFSTIGQSREDNESITIKENKRIYKIDVKDIKYFEAYGDYVKIHTDEKMYTIKKRLSSYDEILSSSFCRVHRSFIINLKKIDYVEGNQIAIGENKIPVSTGFKENFLTRYK